MMLHKGFSVALMAALLGMVGMTRDASATVTITLEWGACGGGAGGCTATGGQELTVAAGGGQTLRLDVYMTVDLTQGLTAHTFSINFDTALEDEFNLGPMAQLEWSGSDVSPNPGIVDNYGPLTAGQEVAESSTTQAGRLNSYDSGGLFNPLWGNGLAYTVGSFTATAPGRYRVGQAFFTTNGAITDGADIFSGAFNGLFDVTVDGNGTEVPQNTFVYGTATLNLVPEPGTVTLLGLGLVGLVLAGRRSRRA